MTLTKNLRSKYNEEVKAALKEKFGYTNDHQIPQLHKIVLNMGVGEASHNTKIAESQYARNHVGIHRHYQRRDRQPYKEPESINFRRVSEKNCKANFNQIGREPLLSADLSSPVEIIQKLDK